MRLPLKSPKLLALLLIALACLPALAQNQTTPLPPANRVFSVSPTGGDWVTQVNALFAACHNACDVHTPAGNYTTRTGTVLMHTAHQTLSGDGPALVNITAAQPNVIDWRLVPDFSFQAGASISGFTLTCAYFNPNKALQSVDHSECITIGSVLGMNLHDVNLYGPGDPASNFDSQGAEALVFQNVNNWMERWRITNVNIGGFAISLHFKTPVLPRQLYTLVTSGGSGYTTIPTLTFPPPPLQGGVTATGTVSIANGSVQQVLMTSNGYGYTSVPQPTLSYGDARITTYMGSGTDSYGYGRVQGLWTNQGAHSFGVRIDPGANVYNLLGFDYQVNSGHTTAADEYFSIAGNFTGVGFHVESENAGAPFTFAHVYSTGHMQFEGTFNGFGLENTVRADPGATFSVLPASNFADTMSGFGSLADYAGTGKTVALYPTQQLQQENPYVTAGQGYVASGSATAPVFLHDPQMPICFGTIPAAAVGQPMSNLRTTFCVFGNGDLHTPGGAVLGGSLAAGSIKANVVTAIHTQTGGPAPRVTTSAGTTVSLSANSTDSSGFVTVSLRAPVPAGALLFQLAFGSAWSGAPKCWLFPASLTTSSGANTAFVSPADISATGFRATLVQATATGPSTWAYKCEQ